MSNPNMFLLKQILPKPVPVVTCSPAITLIVTTGSKY